MEPNVTRLMSMGMLLKKKLFFCLFFFLLTSAAGATEYIEKPHPGDQTGASIKGDEVIGYSDFTIHWQFILWVVLVNVLSTIDLLLYSKKFIYMISGFRITQNVKFT